MRAVATVVDLLVDTFGGRRLLLAVQLFERVAPDSLAAVAARFAWSQRTTYEIDPPGRSHGLLVGTSGWAPAGI